MANYRIEKWKELYAPDAGELTLQLEREGYDVFRVTDNKGTIYGLHNHHAGQSHWIISGAMEFTVEGKSYVLNAGDRDFLLANIYHSSQVLGEEAVVYLVGIKN